MGANPVTSKTTSKRKKTSWPLAFTSTTSTSGMESATCLNSHNHVCQHLQSSMVQHLHSQWARELRAYLNINQFERIDLLDFAYDAEQPLTTDITVQQTPAGRPQYLETVRLTQARQDLRDERALPAKDPQRRENVIDEQRTEQPVTSTTANQHRLGSVQTIETSIRCRSSCTRIHLTTEHCSSTN